MLVLSETAASSEEKATLCLDRLAGVERRIGSIPVVSIFSCRNEWDPRALVKVVRV